MDIKRLRNSFFENINLIRMKDLSQLPFGKTIFFLIKHFLFPNQRYHVIKNFSK